MDIYNSDWINIDGNNIHKTAIIYSNVQLGTGNTIGAFCVIGSNGEIRGTKDFNGRVIIGDNNIISEMVTIQRPANETQRTAIGSNNLIMAHTHIGHDVTIGNNTELCTGTIVGGYAQIKDGAKIKLGVTIRNRIIIGERALIGMGSIVVKNVESDSIVKGNPAK